MVLIPQGAAVELVVLQVEVLPITLREVIQHKLTLQHNGPEVLNGTVVVAVVTCTSLMVLLMHGEVLQLVVNLPQDILDMDRILI
jgi:hypothetical protein